MKTEREIIQDLASGFKIRLDQDEWYHSYHMAPPGRYDIQQSQVEALVKAGWLRGFANGGGFKLSDEGHKAYNRAMDEMGDGKLIAPNESGQEQK